MKTIRTVAGVLYNVAVFGLTLFLPAGTLRWPRAWIFLGVAALGTAATMYVLANDQDLLRERFRSPIQKAQPLADRIILVLFILSFVGAIVFIPLDRFHFQLLPATGLAVGLAGLLVFIAGWAMITAALHENSFAAPVVKYQSERHQTVIDTGLYAFVRHPMYAGVIPILTGMALWLGSYAGVIVGLVPIGLISIRVRIEERFLSRELSGYTTYMGRVKYRLVPFVW